MTKLEELEKMDASSSEEKETASSISWLHWVTIFFSFVTMVVIAFWLGSCFKLNHKLSDLNHDLSELNHDVNELNELNDVVKQVSVKRDEYLIDLISFRAIDEIRGTIMNSANLEPEKVRVVLAYALNHFYNEACMITGKCEAVDFQGYLEMSEAEREAFILRLRESFPHLNP